MPVSIETKPGPVSISVPSWCASSVSVSGPLIENW